MASSLGHGKSDANPRTRDGLSDARVELVHDRGYQFYLADHPRDPAGLHTGSMPLRGDGKIFEDTRDNLGNRMVYYPPQSSKTYFLPLDQLDEVMTLQTIRTLVASMPECEAFSLAEKEQFARSIRFGDSSGHTPGRCDKPCAKLLAALIRCRMERKFLRLVNDHVNDSCFPLEPLPGHGFRLRCKREGHTHPYLASLGTQDSRCLCSESHTLSVPYLKWTPDCHAHYVLGPDDILPIVSKKSNGSEPSRTSPGKQRNPSTQATSETGMGGFGKVERVTFHRSHFNFGEYGDGRQNHNYDFAIKTLNSSSVDDFNRELASLLSCQNTEEMHLIRLLATIEIREPTERGIESKFKLIFPWADFNLWDFWQTHSREDDRVHRCTWMAEQCYRLAQALAFIHNERDGTMLRLRMSNDEKTLYGRHGDLKAENILYFQLGDRLVIADFGLGRLHTKISRSNQNPHNLAMTNTYAAPEFELKDGRVSRSCDIFALGCTFLEFVTWYLLGGNAPEEFAIWRIDVDELADFQTDYFYQIKHGPGDTVTPILKPKVQSWIDTKLKKSPLLNRYILEFLEVIVDTMLATVPCKRISSGQLERKLKVLHQACLDEPEDYLKSIPPSDL